MNVFVNIEFDLLGIPFALPSRFAASQRRDDRSHLSYVRSLEDHAEDDLSGRRATAEVHKAVVPASGPVHHASVVQQARFTIHRQLYLHLHGIFRPDENGAKALVGICPALWPKPDGQLARHIRQSEQIALEPVAFACAVDLFGGYAPCEGQLLLIAHRTDADLPAYVGQTRRLIGVGRIHRGCRAWKFDGLPASGRPEEFVVNAVANTVALRRRPQNPVDGAARFYGPATLQGETPV
mmetsp:Transcript_73216/g.203075  ORF Transcript_73216/g.203075 Transcript_73216/m.203075 type:complete len:238 (+) Transcript_73216:538-1251(+)